ncbi:TPR repeat-containing serine/threonin protein kinase [Rivularia sp. IAM M-261]|nr:TPR repeat-containing serine/threonin protein kinase [Rivularia sp. IAM M-261]
MSQLLGLHYQIIQVLSQDQVGENYIVADIEEKISTYYIFKKIFIHNSSEQELNSAMSSLNREIQTLQKIGHQHETIQQIFTYWIESKEVCLLKEFIQGNSLSHIIEQQTHSTEEEIVNIFLSLLKILVYIHGQGIIHRNIKPSNIIQRELDGEYVLIDFGSDEAAINYNLGISEYMPMEQYHGSTQFNSDIYALGVIAISMLTNLPASEITGINSPRNFITGEIRWRHRSRKVSRRLAHVINKMVKLDYRCRYQSALDALIDIRPLQDKYFSIKEERKAQIHLILLVGAASFIIVGILSLIIIQPKNITQAEEFYQQGINKYEAQNYQAAITSFSEAIDINANYAAAYNRRGDSYYRLGDYNKSVVDSSAAIRLNPKDANSYYDRGFSLYSLGDYIGAITDYNQAIKLDAKNSEFYYARGLARNKIKDRQRAFEDMNKAIALNPELVVAYVERAKMFRKQGNKLDAGKNFDQAVALQPENAELYYERGLNYYELNQKQAAKKDFTKAIEIDAKYIKAYLARGDVYSDLADPEKAYNDYSQALSLNDKYPDTYIHWGNFRLKNNDVTGAFADFNKAIALESDNASAYNYRGNANLERGFWQNAIKDYTKAISINSEYALAYYNRGLVFTDLGKVAKAISDFNKAAQLFKDKGEKDSYNDAKARLKELGV